MSDNESKITFTKDVIKQVSKELNIDEKKLAEVYDSMMSYLHYLINETDSVAIFIKNLGTLHVKVGYIYERIKQYKYSKNENKLKIFNKKIEILNDFFKNYYDNKFRVKPRHLDKFKINSLFYNNGKSVSEIEEFQNEESR